jgi:hypothetical protein
MAFGAGDKVVVQTASNVNHVGVAQVRDPDGSSWWCVYYPSQGNPVFGHFPASKVWNITDGAAPAASLRVEQWGPGGYSASLGNNPIVKQTPGIGGSLG